MLPKFSWKRPNLAFLQEMKLYFRFLYKYIRKRGYKWFSRFEILKDVIVDLLYKKRGKYSRPFLHFGTIALAFFMITFGPFLVQRGRNQQSPDAVLPAGVMNTGGSYSSDITTAYSLEVQQVRGGEIIIHTVQSGDTLSSIAQKYGLNDVNTIIWENDLAKDAKLTPGEELRILPIDGVRHKVQRGETIFTIAKLYGLDENQAQRIIDYPFNEFKNDETFELAVGQTIMVPGGIKQEAVATSEAPAIPVVAPITPSAGSVTASGSFVWPTQGRITQFYSFFHKAFDIANHDGGNILAADSGTVIAAGWDTTGYGNKIMIDHANGYVTLYGHLSVLQVRVGQTVRRGSVIGQMGSTGHSTGTHLHFEIRHGGVLEDPGRYLK